MLPYPSVQEARRAFKLDLNLPQEALDALRFRRMRLVAFVRPNLPTETTDVVEKFSTCCSIYLGQFLVDYGHQKKNDVKPYRLGNTYLKLGSNQLCTGSSTPTSCSRSRAWIMTSFGRVSR